MLSLLLLAIGCGGGGGCAGGDGVAEAEGTTDDPGRPDDPDTTTEPTPPCADGTWMGESSPRGLVFVRPGSPGGDGTYADPYGDVLRAVLDARETGGTVALFPSTYTLGHTLGIQAPPGGSLTVTGCGDETVLVVPGGATAAAALQGPGETVLRRVTVDGGSPAVAIRAGTTGLVEDVTITRATRVGLQVAGPTTVATVRRLHVSGKVHGVGAGVRGWGVSLADGTLVIEEGTITGQEGYGLYAERGSLTVRGLEVFGDLRQLGVAGIYAHAMHDVVLDDVTVTDVSGVGIHLVEVANATITGSTVRRVVPSVRTNARGQGDGIVVRQGDRPSALTTLTGNVVSDAARLGIALDGGSVTLSENTTSGNGVDADGASVWATRGTDVIGTAAELDPLVYPLGRDERPGEGPAGFRRPGMP